MIGRWLLKVTKGDGCIIPSLSGSKIIGTYLVLLLLLLLHEQRMLLHYRLQLGWSEDVLLQQLLHLMQPAGGIEHCLRGRTTLRSRRRRTLRGIRG